MSDYVYRPVDKHGIFGVDSLMSRDEAYEWIVTGILEFDEPTDLYHVERRPAEGWEPDDISD